MGKCTFTRSAERVRAAGATVSGGVNSNFRMGVAPTPLVFERGEGAYLLDIDGNRLIDYYLALGPMVLGHSPRDVVEAAKRQLDIGLLYGGQSELEYLAAAKVVEMVPCAERVRFAGSGTEAVQLALRLARAVTGRSTVIKFEGHYHGWVDSVLWSTSTPQDQLGPEDAPVKHAASAGQDLPAGQNLELMSWNRAEPLLARLAKGDVAAVIMEATMCNSGGIFAAPGYLEAVREACTRHGTILIFDEVITGFRIGPGGAQQRLGVTPDLATFAKAIANGFTVAAVAGRAEVMDRLVDGAIMHGGTYNAQPAAMAAAIATMDRLSKPGAHDGMERQGTKLMRGIEAAFAEAGMPVYVGGYPQIFTVNLGVTGKPSNYRGLAKVDKAAYRKFTTALLGHGVRALERGAWFLSTEHDEKVVDRTLDAVRAAIAEVAPELQHLRA
ncbi:aspartate aminotransferase family protein [Mesorhizobium sp. ZMM04-5]|uniref:Aspartate aminotransferase family protein n=1 Tax=Mesorhizobium marinum TaxID=3228790 RepID=A0ABV3R2Z9_9HYPH